MDHVPIRTHGRECPLQDAPDGSHLTSVFGGEIRDVAVVVEGVTLYREPHWTRQSPNGRYFASWAYDTGEPYSKYQGLTRFMIYVGSLGRSWCRVLDPDGDEEFAWSPDSTRIALSISAGKRVFRPSGQGYYQSALPRSTEIYVVGIDGSRGAYVLEQPGNWRVCDWSPDGKKLLLLQKRSTEKDQDLSDLVEFDLEAAVSAGAKSGLGGRVRGNRWAAGGAVRYLRPLLRGVSERDPEGARYSPSGKYLAVEYSDHAKLFLPTKHRGARQFLGKLAVFEIATGGIKTIADYPDGLRGPICWSPDSKEILFSRYRSGGDDREDAKSRDRLAIWAIGTNGNDARLLTDGWSPDWR